VIAAIAFLAGFGLPALVYLPIVAIGRAMQGPAQRQPKKRLVPGVGWVGGA
jgi:hypothetical protein